MPRAPRADRPVEKTINIPQSTCTKVDLLLWSELEGKVPHGAWSRYINGLIEQDLKARADLQEALARGPWGKKFPKGVGNGQG